MPHPNTHPIFPADSSVLIEDQPVVTAGWSANNNTAPISGEPTVLIAGYPAATLSIQDDRTDTEHPPVSGKPTVLIGNRPATLQ